MLDTASDGHLIVEIYGYDTYDPTTRTVQPSDGDDIDSWMVDTAHDGQNFFPHLFYAPGAKNPSKYFGPLEQALGRQLDPDSIKALTGLCSQPFPAPEPEFTVAVKIITRAGHEMTTLLDPGELTET